ncbi:MULTISPECIES: capreomycidine synthase [Streptomyces]|uniref:Capreomycidine synthase n=1 Tax=Streptomyces dengpaensis TaxID=2049881 RepID=A0ABM6SJ40_9ACTN|nr:MULTISPECIES: capreomycidine synthase [Streptomyces]AVH54672.1 capreomycidine synthase [Streptomyces dengpaensis]
MHLPRAALEDWMRDFYFDTSIDLGSSGVQCWSLAELRRLLGITVEELDGISLDDTPSYGGAALRQAIADRFAAGDTNRVMTTHGSTEAIFAVMNALLSAGDEVVVVDPAYHSLTSVAEAIGCRLVRWQLRPESGFTPDLDDLRALVTPDTRMIVVNFPHNPTGAHLTREQFDDLLALVDGHDLHLVWDGAFAELVHDREQLPDPATLHDRCIGLGTMSKAYGLPGTRVGWCLAAPEILARLVPLRDALTICLSPVTEFLAARALAGADRILADRRAQAARNLGRLGTWAEENADLMSWTPPSGGVTAFPAFRGVTDTEDLCQVLGSRYDVLLVPGSGFGHSDRVRLGFGGAEDAFGEGLARLRKALVERRGTR